MEKSSISSSSSSSIHQLEVTNPSSAFKSQDTPLVSPDNQVNPSVIYLCMHIFYLEVYCWLCDLILNLLSILVFVIVFPLNQVLHINFEHWRSQDFDLRAYKVAGARAAPFEMNSKTEVPFLPEEIVFKIFLLLPAKVLHDVMRTVCQLWRKVIRDPDFIKAHRLHSTIYPVCISFNGFSHNGSFDICSLDDDEIAWESMSETIDQLYLSNGDGFILTADHEDNSILYLVNPLTKQIYSMPKLKSSCTDRLKVACSHLTLKCKVVVLRWPILYILTVGNDKEWREIDLVGEPDLNCVTSARLCNNGSRGLICWYDKYKLDYMTVLDVENEVFHKVVVPNEVPGNFLKICSGTSLVANYYSTEECREFYELVDCRNGGEWRKMGVIDFESRKREIEELMDIHISLIVDYFKLIGILSSDSVIFRHRDPFFLVTYNFKTGKFSRCFDYPDHYPWKLMMEHNLVLF